MRDVKSDRAAKAMKTTATRDARGPEPREVKQRIDILLDAPEEVPTSSEEDELTDQEEAEPKRKESVAKPTDEANQKATNDDKRRKCPVPGCDVQKGRLTHINKHLKSGHGVPLEKGQAGDLEALRARQDEQFRLWCEEQGLPSDIPRDQKI